MRPGLITKLDTSHRMLPPGGARACFRRLTARPRREREKAFVYTLTGTQENISFLTQALSAGYAGQRRIRVYVDTTVGGTVGGANYAAVTGDFRAYNPRAELTIHVLGGRKILGKGGVVGGTGGRALRIDMPNVKIILVGEISGGGDGGANGVGGQTCLGTGSKSCDTVNGVSTGGSGGGGAGYEPASGATQTTPGSGSAGGCCQNGPGCNGGGQYCGSAGSAGTVLGTNAAIVPNGFTYSLFSQGGTINGTTT